MDNIKILDCTLRDGGYINDWHFGKITIKSIIRGLIKANTDFIELGFLRDCEYDENKTLYNNIAEAKNFIPQNIGNTKFTLMALHDKYDINKLENNDGTIFAIRITFHNYDIDEGLNYIERLMSKGYNVFVNPINIMGYSTVELLSLLKRVNEIKPYAFSIVDTFGSMRFGDFQRIYSLCKHELNEDIHIGLHLHENMMMANSIAQKFYNLAKKGDIIDASLNGMGREPGNLCIELIMDYINHESKENIYYIDSLLEIIDNHILSIKSEHPWGYMPEYFLSAKYNLHRNYAEYLINKGNVSAKAIDDILSQIIDEKKADYDNEYVEKIYLKYQNNIINDDIVIDKFKNQIFNKNILILAPGNSINIEKDKINKFIFEKNPFIISANFIPTIYEADRYFFSNEKRLSVFYQNSNLFKFLITSNIKNYELDAINFNTFSNNPVKSDISVPILLNLLCYLNIEKVYLAGFDGFKSDEQAFFDNSLNFIGIQRKNIQKSNDEIKKCIKEIGKKINIEFLTKSHYVE